MRTFSLLAGLLLAVAVSANSLPIVDYTSRVPFGHHVRPSRNVDIIVIHSTHCLDGDPFNVNRMLTVFRRYKVASHYIIDRTGVIYRLVREKDIAYHAGRSVLPQTGRKMLNGSSIGIELLNSPIDPPTELQYKALAALVKDIKTRYPVRYIVGHSDIASDRKTDPWLFDWKKFDAMIQ